MIALLLLILINTVTSEEIKAVFVMTRHGDRTVYANITNIDSCTCTKW